MNCGKDVKGFMLVHDVKNKFSETSAIPGMLLSEDLFR